jgi:hypothetical protein
VVALPGRGSEWTLEKLHIHVAHPTRNPAGFVGRAILPAVGFQPAGPAGNGSRSLPEAPPPSGSMLHILPAAPHQGCIILT